MLFFYCDLLNEIESNINNYMNFGIYKILWENNLSEFIITKVLSMEIFLSRLSNWLKTRAKKKKK